MRSGRLGPAPQFCVPARGHGRPSRRAGGAALRPAGGTALAVQSTAGFPASGQIYVGSELLTYGTTTATTFNITSPPTYAKAHPSGSFVRAQGKLKLVAR